jgi:pilus assembly protein CpaF
MALIDRLKPRMTGHMREPELRSADPLQPGAAPGAAHQELKSRVHNLLFEHLDLSRLNKVSEDQVAQDVVLATNRILDGEKVLLTLEERERLVEEIKHEVFGLGRWSRSSRTPAWTTSWSTAPGRSSSSEAERSRRPSHASRTTRT